MNVVIGFDPSMQRTKSRVLWQPMHIRAAHPEVLVDLIDTLDIFSRGRYSSCAVSVVDTLYVIGRTRPAITIKCVATADLVLQAAR